MGEKAEGRERGQGSHSRHSIRTWGHSQDNLDSIVKSRDITLPTKVHPVQVMVFPVVMYACESWPIKKAEH